MKVVKRGWMKRKEGYKEKGENKEASREGGIIKGKRGGRIKGWRGKG